MMTLHTRSIRPARRARRGVAMLLVIIALTMATILSVAYLASRDNSAVIGQNVASAASSRWASMSGIDYGIAILQTEADWRTEHVAGKLIDDLPVADSLLDLDLVDMVTDGPPGASTEYVRLISTADTAGVSSVTVAEAYVPVEYGETVTVDLSDFAVFAADSISITDDALVTRWSAAPESDMASRIAIGTRSTSASAIKIENNATFVDTSIFYGPGASEYLISLGNDTPLQEVALLDHVPLPAGPTYPVSTTPSATSAFAPTAATLIAGDARYTSVNIQTPASEVVLQGDLTFVSESDLRLAAGSGLLVDGDVTLVVLDDVILEDTSYIELTPGSTLTMFVTGDVSLINGYIGDQRADHSLRDTTGEASYLDPMSIRITGDNAPKLWSLTETSLIKGSIYMPTSTQSISDSSAIYGRVTAQTISVSEAGAIYYDPALDTGSGFTNLDSPLYDADGYLKAAFRTLAKLDNADLTSLATAENIKVKANGNSVGTAPADTTMPPEGEATPRPIPVDWYLVTTGADSASWEQKGDQYIAPVDPLQTDANALATTISGTPLLQFVGLTSLQMSARRSELANFATKAGGSIDQVKYADAIAFLQSIRDRTDGLPLVSDTMLIGAARTNIYNEATRIMTELQAR